MAVAYGELTARYWLTPENYSGLATNIDWAALGASQLHTRYVPLAQPRQGATGHVEYTFDASLGNLAASGTSGEIRSRFNNQAYGDLDENDDYSYRLNSWSYAPNDHITPYRNGRLVWGTEPASASASAARSTGATTALATATATAASSQVALLEAYPDPVTSATTVQFQAAQAARALVQVYNPLGQLVATLYDGTVEDGRTYQLPFAAQALYECRLVLAGQALTQRLVVNH